jgi:predicted dehydrogenase
LRVGVIGTGFGARVVAPVFQDTDDCQVVDVVSARDAAAVASLCKRSDVDLISIHSPPFLHLQHVRLAVNAGHAVLCDKPLGRNAAEAEEMRELAEEALVMNFVNYEFRYHPVRRHLRQLVREGLIGQVEHVQWTSWCSHWRADAGRLYGWVFDTGSGGGWIRIWGSHNIDFLIWTFGAIVEASAALRTTVPARPDPSGRLHSCTSETGFTAALRTGSGVSITIDSTATAPVERPNRVTLIGDGGVLEMLSDNVHEIGGWLELHTDRGPSEIFRVDQQGDNHALEMTPWAAKIRDALRHRMTETDMPTFTDGVACAYVMDRLTVERNSNTDARG